MSGITAQKDYKGIIYDSKTNETLPYVNIGILNKGVGTVSNELGVFHLELNPEDYTTMDTLLISSMGYKTIKKAVPELEFRYNDYVEIRLLPQHMKLSEVVVTDKGTFELNQNVGYQNFGHKTYGYWKDNIALGGELATKIRVKKGLRKLNRLFFNVLHNPSDSVLVRVNIYDDDGRMQFPKTNLNTSGRNILFPIRSDTEIALIDLEPFDIFVKNDFIVSLELLKVYGDKDIGLVLSASENRSTDSYKKYASQSKWELIGDTAMAYHLNTTLYAKKNRGDSKVRKTIKATKNQKKISGFVLYAGKPLSDVRIINYSTNERTTTNENGRYEILAKKGDLLGFEFQGMKKTVFKILDRTRINLVMDPV